MKTGSASKPLRDDVQGRSRRPRADNLAVEGAVLGWSRAYGPAAAAVRTSARAGSASACSQTRASSA
jgi:hypothetical protein